MLHNNNVYDFLLSNNFSACVCVRLCKCVCICIYVVYILFSRSFRSAAHKHCSILCRVSIQALNEEVKKIPRKCLYFLVLFLRHLCSLAVFCHLPVRSSAPVSYAHTNCATHARCHIRLCHMRVYVNL